MKSNKHTERNCIRGLCGERKIDERREEREKRERLRERRRERRKIDKPI